MPRRKIVRLKKGDHLLEDGAEWPVGAWEVYGFEGDLVSLVRPQWYNDWWSPDTRAVLALDEIASNFRRIEEPKSIARLYGTELLAGDGKNVLVVVHGVLPGPVALAWEPSADDAMRLALAFLDFKILPLERWSRWQGAGGIIYEAITPLGEFTIEDTSILEAEGRVWEIESHTIAKPTELAGTFDTAEDAWREIQEYARSRRSAKRQ